MMWYSYSVHISNEQNNTDQLNNNIEPFYLLKCQQDQRSKTIFGFLVITCKLTYIQHKNDIVLKMRK